MVCSGILEACMYVHALVYAIHILLAVPVPVLYYFVSAQIVRPSCFGYMCVFTTNYAIGLVYIFRQWDLMDYKDISMLPRAFGMCKIYDLYNTDNYL